MEKILIAVGAPDPDNFALISMCYSMFGKENVLGVLLTGRPVNLNATKETPIDEWNLKESKLVQQMSAARMKVFMKKYGVETAIFDGGIAPNTLVPHHLHFKDYYKFEDIDPLQALSKNQLSGISDLEKAISGEEITILVGGPMTGVYNLLTKNPGLRVKSLHAMYGALGTVKLTNFGSETRGQRQFNVVCDSKAGKYVLENLHCPIYLVPTDCTRDERLAFNSPAELRKLLEGNEGNSTLLNLYEK
jgi:hypothetical protein